MAKGISLHIGLNGVDPDAYNGWDGALSGCINDTQAMKQIADACGYQSSILTNGQATSSAVIEAIGQAAQQLEAGDYYLLTYSGHGGQVEDANGDENDTLDETWVLYDRELVDDELYSLWSQFAAGVRIFMLSDSCHSGTVARDMYVQVRPALRKKFRALPEAPRLKVIPHSVAQAVEKRDRALYRTVQWIAGNSRDMPIAASVILVSGCQDNQNSEDGDQNGLFTQNLLEVWNNGQFEGTYPSFHAAIQAKMPPTQTPNYFKVGATDFEFESHRPFDILGGMSVEPSTQPSTSPTTQPAAPGKPSITGPSSARRGEPPTFQVDLAGNPYFIFEIGASQGVLDNYPDPNDPQYYGSWNDPDAPARLTGDSYTLPEAAWELVSGSDTLYYRIATTSSGDANGWDDYQVSDVGTLSVEAERTRGAPPPRPVAGRPPRPHAPDLP